MRALVQNRMSFVSLLVALLLASSAAGAQDSPTLVWYRGGDDAVRQALELTPLTRLTTDLSKASVVVINDVRLSDAELLNVAKHVADGAGLILFLGSQCDESTLKALDLARIAILKSDDAATLEPVESDSRVIAEINWRVAPQVYERYVPHGETLTALVTVHGEPDDIVLAETMLGKGSVFLLAPCFENGANKPFVEWFYFNYLVYALVTTAAGQQPLSYADYPGSPVPHRPLQILMVVLLTIVFSSTLLIFWLVRRYSRRHPELLYQLVANVEVFRAREGSSEWEAVGFHRGIASFMVAILNNVWLFVPISILTNVVLFGKVLPSAQIRGAVSLVMTFFGTVWTFMDWGTAVAGQKFLSQYRVTDPGEGMKYVQFFVWWQAITGTIQVGAIALFALFVIPHNTALAYLSIYILLHVLIQFPGFGHVFNGVVFPGLHRFDYQQLIATIFLVTAPICQIVLCAIAVSWGGAHPAYASIAGGLGLGFGALVSIAVIFLTGFFLYRRLGLAARVIFLAHFDLRAVKTALLFGAPITATGLLFTGAFSLQVWLLSKLVLNYAEVQANFDVAISVGTGAYLAILAMTTSLINSHSEAYSQGKLKLCRYYMTMSLRWGELLCTFLTAVLFAVGDRFVLGSLPAEQYARAAVWLRILAVWWSLCVVVWVGDGILIGIGKPELHMVSMLVEQGTRIVMMLLLAPRLQAWAMVVAYMIALPLKAIVDMIFVKRYLKRIIVCWWQTLVAPFASAAIICVLLRLWGGLYWTPDPVKSSVLLFVGLVAALPLHFFLVGVFGGWDDQGLGEFRRAVPISSVAKPMAWLFLKCTELGISISPLHNRFPVTTCEEAMIEAEEIGRTKVRLDHYGPNNREQ